MKKFYILLITMLIVSGAKAQWVPQNSGTTNDLKSVCFPIANKGYAVGTGGTILKTTDGGETWMTQVSGTTKDLFSLCFTNAVTGYAVGDSGTILKTTTGGAYWNPQSSGTSNNLRCVQFPAEDTGYAVGTGSIVLKTTNGGTNWFIQNTNSSYYINSVYFTDANTGYAVGSAAFGWSGAGIILKTTNGGWSWTLLYSYATTTYNCSFNTVYFSDAETGYAVGSVLGYFGWPVELKTLNGGIEWTNVNYVISPDSFHFPVTDTGYAVGGWSTVVKTTDGGNNWISQYTNMEISLNDVYFTDSETGYVVGENGTILKTENGGGMPVGIDESAVSSQQSAVVSCYPNPTAGSSQFTVRISQYQYVTLKVYDIQGREVAVLIDENLPAGEHTVSYDVSGLPAGIYFYRFAVGGQRSAVGGKIVKL